MITQEIRYGGTLKIGDFIAIAANHYLYFGWYCGNGKAGNIQYVGVQEVAWQFKEFNDRQSGKSYGVNHKDRKGFSLDHFRKNPLRNNKKHTVIKITDPEEMFTQYELTEYLKAKEILTNMKFLKQ